MATIAFYEKPGCGGNTRQRALLQAAGHQLRRHNLLTVPWTAATLQPWLAGLPVAEWFNRAAPRIKSGELVPETLAAETALAWLLAEPLLIRRPLMQRDDGARLVGFDLAEVDAFVGLPTTAADQPQAAAKTPVRGAATRSLEGCTATARPCPSSTRHA